VSPGSSAPAVHVVAGAVIDAAGRTLIAQRPPGKHLAGAWEFPGGKLHPSEDRRVGLARELREELGIEIRSPRPLIRLRHTYDYGEVLLDMWVVRHFSGDPQGLDGQALRWCTPGQLQAAELLPADKLIVAALRLPEVLTEASTPSYEIHDFCGVTSLKLQNISTVRRLQGLLCDGAEEGLAAAQIGADFLVMRRAQLASDLLAVCHSVCIPVYARGSCLPELWALGASGINDIGF
jgi:mutator protein MutT